MRHLATNDNLCCRCSKIELNPMLFSGNGTYTTASTMTGNLLSEGRRKQLVRENWCQPDIPPSCRCLVLSLGRIEKVRFSTKTSQYGQLEGSTDGCLCVQTAQLMSRTVRSRQTLGYCRLLAPNFRSQDALHPLTVASLTQTPDRPRLRWKLEREPRDKG